MAEVAIPLAIGLGSASAGIGVIQSSQQNRALKRTADATARAAEVQQKQLVEAAEIERIKRQRESAAVNARLRLSAIESGVGSGSYSALFAQNQYDLSSNLNIIDRSLSNQLEAVRSGAQANLSELSARQMNPLLAGFTQGLQGFSTGLNIAMATSAAQQFSNSAGSGSGQVVSTLPYSARRGV